MAKTDKKTRSMALYETILKLKDIDECCRFFDDLCTPTELRSMEQRFDVAVYLEEGLVYQPGAPVHAGQRRGRRDAAGHPPGVEPNRQAGRRMIGQKESRE